MRNPNRNRRLAARRAVPALRCLLALPLVLLSVLRPASLAAQEATGTVTGTVTRSDDGSPLVGVQVTVQGGTITATTGGDGRYTLRRVPAGPAVLVFRWLGYRPQERSVTVPAGGEATADAALEPAPLALTEIVVSGASRSPERIVEAPAAVSVVDPQIIQNTSITGQAPLALATVPGVDLVQNGVNDFNVNARGFNSSLNRRVLVLLDGRDLAVAFLGSQEWYSLPVPLEDLDKIEMVRGPGSALYGANAFSGVLAMRTPAVRDMLGTRVSVGGGELGTIRGDLRHASLFGNGRFGLRANIGYYRSDTWSRSRTGVGDFREEYRPAVSDTTLLPSANSVEARPLEGQANPNAPNPGTATGDRDDLQNIYGSVRFDAYTANDGIFTVEGGGALNELETLATGIGRVQVINALRPYARLFYGQRRFNVSAWWNGRIADDTTQGQRSLASGAFLSERSNIFQGEVQGNQPFAGDRGRVVVGGAYRRTFVDTKGTLMNLANDDRNDWIASAYGQVEFDLIPQLKLVGALRFDDGNLFAPQWSPKGALVYSVNDNHSFRVSVNRAFQTPNYSEFFLQVAAGRPQDLRALEAALRASPLGPALAGVPPGALFDNSAAVPVLALGNADLDVESTVGWEAGYKGVLAKRILVTLDAYTANIRNFVTDLLPGVNPAYAPWTAPDAVPAQFRPQVEAAVRAGLAQVSPLASQGITRVEGTTAIAVSYANAGEVVQRGLEGGVGYQITNDLRLDGSLTWFDFDIRSQAQGDSLLPNTPEWKGSLSLSYAGSRNGIDASVTARFVDSYLWAAGVFAGFVPSSQQVTVSAGYRFARDKARIFATATNVFDQQRYQFFGAAVVGRRVMGGVSYHF